MMKRPSRKNNSPSHGAESRNHERLKKIVRDFLTEILNEYRWQRDRILANEETRSNAYVQAQAKYYELAIEVLTNIIRNRLQPDSKHAAKADEIDGVTQDGSSGSDA